MVVGGGSGGASTDVLGEPMELRKAGLTWHVVGDEVVVLDLEKSTYLKLNGTARMLWEGLSTSSTEVELVAVLAARFGIAEERAAGDVAEFLSDLRRRDLLAG
jgi:hypothetical protein